MSPFLSLSPFLFRSPLAPSCPHLSFLVELGESSSWMDFSSTANVKLYLIIELKRQYDLARVTLKVVSSLLLAGSERFSADLRYWMTRRGRAVVLLRQVVAIVQGLNLKALCSIQPRAIGDKM